MEKPNSSNQRDDESHSLKGKLNEKFEDVYHFAQTNRWDTAGYAVLFLGLILLLVKPFWGGLLIGAVGGVYFSDWIVKRMNRVKEDVEREGVIRSLILGGLLLAFFIVAPAIFIGAAIAVAVKQVMAAREPS